MFYNLFNDFIWSHFGQVFNKVQLFKVAEVFWNASTAGFHYQLLHFMLFCPIAFVCITFAYV